jgi:hypothetical protein
MGLCPPDVSTAEMLATRASHIKFYFLKHRTACRPRSRPSAKRPSAIPFLLCNTARISRGWKLVIVCIKASVFYRRANFDPALVAVFLVG